MLSKCDAVILCRTSLLTTRVLWAENEEKRSSKKKEKTKKLLSLAKILVLENPGIDPGTSRMQSGRSTIWANSPEHIQVRKVISEIPVIE